MDKYRVEINFPLQDTCVYSNDCHSEAAISGDFPKAERVSNNSAFKIGCILHCRSPRIITTGVHWGCSQRANRAFSLWKIKKNYHWCLMIYIRLNLVSYNVHCNIVNCNIVLHIIFLTHYSSPNLPSVKLDLWPPLSSFCIYFWGQICQRLLNKVATEFLHMSSNYLPISQLS